MVARAGLLACVLVLVAAPSAFAHAELEATTPARGAQLERAPARITFDFSEPVEAAFGAVKVFDARGARVDADKVVRLRGDVIGVDLRPGLGDGSYTATYRVISADGHPVSGGTTFTVGKPVAGPAKSVDELLGSATAGTVTRGAFDAARSLVYLAIALVVGTLGFLWWCRPAAARELVGEGAWADALATRAVRVMLVAAILGTVAAAAVVVLQGALAGGTSGWSALRPDVVREVLGTRLGRAFGIAVVSFALLGVGAAVGRPDRRRFAAAAVPAVALVLLPALAGHASTQSPRGLLVAMDVAHVGAMALWLGGLACLVAVVPAATRRLAAADRTRLPAALLQRFSTLALLCVVVLVVSGAVQGLVHLGAVHELWDSTFGRLLLAKIALLAVVVALGALNRRRLLPDLRRAAADGAAPGATGFTLRRTLRAEVLLLVAVLGVTGVLVTQPPRGATAAGPQAVQRPLGPLSLTLTVDPARTGANVVHLYLFTRKDGAQFDGTKELRVRFALPAKGIAPIAATLRKAGPGHYVADTMALQPAGEWRVLVSDRVSDFDEYTTTATVRIR